MRGQTDDSWNPHARLEFLKVAFCLVFSLNISEMRKVVNEEISKTDEELNQIEDFTITALSRQEIRLDKMNTMQCIGKSHWKGDLLGGEFCKDHGQITTKLAKMYIMMCEKYALKYNWR